VYDVLEDDFQVIPYVGILLTMLLPLPCHAWREVVTDDVRGLYTKFEPNGSHLRRRDFERLACAWVVVADSKIRAGISEVLGLRSHV
jgi:hypothetical protein